MTSAFHDAAPTGESATALAGLRAAVAERRDRGLPNVRFWWRDDDLVADGEAFQRLSSLSERLACAALVAVIPGHASPRLPETLGAASPHLWFAQHGHVHANHEPTEAPSSEFGRGRVGLAGIRDIAEGRAIMLSMGLARLLDVFVPPWNRLDPLLLSVLPRLGFTGLSGYEGHVAYTEAEAARFGLAARHTSVEILRWSRRPTMLTVDDILVRITSLIRGLAPGDGSAHRGLIGILTHHRVMGAEDFEALETVFRLVGDMVGCDWIEPRDVFA